MMIPPHTIPSLSGTFGIPARLALNPKMPKEPSSPSRSNAKTERYKKLIINALMNKGQLVILPSVSLCKNPRKLLIT
jgi:hypothetical protein